MEDWTPRAQRLLARGTRRRKPPTVYAGFLQWLTDGKIPLTDALRTFLEQIDVLDYAVRPTGRTTTFGLTTEMVTDNDNQPYIECGDISTAPLLFFLGLNGRLTVSDGDSPPLAIASAIHVYIESDAVLDELPDLNAEWYRVGFGEISRDDLRLDYDVDLPMIPAASDAYTRWWGDGRVRVHRAIVWDDDLPRDQISGYVRTQGDAELLTKRLSAVLERGAPFSMSRIV